MRFLHTADWHLGRSLHGASLLEDQSHLLDELVRLARSARPDLVVVAGDVFDRAVPPIEAVQLLDGILACLVLDLGLPTLLIAGNHDNPVRLAFGARLMEQSRLAIVGEARPRTVFSIDDRWGSVAICAVPYAEPATVREAFGGEVRDHEAAFRVQVAALQPLPHARAVVAAHAFVTGGTGSESERPLSVGGAGCVPAACFAGFSYAALGHLHRPQYFDGGRVHYSGSLHAYGFDEVGHEKSVSLVELDGAGRVEVETITLSPRRRLREVRGTLDGLLHGAGSDDYVSAVLEDTGALLDPHARLKAVFPNLLKIERPFYAPGGGARPAEGRLPTERGVPELFADFFGQVTGGPLSDEERSTLAELVELWQLQQRDAA